MGVWLRPFIPSWRFFDKAMSFPKLYARVVSHDSPNQDWASVLSPPKLRWFSIFINPDGNLHHAYCNALDQLVRHPECEEARTIIDRLVRRFLLNNECHLVGARYYQFKVTVVESQGARFVEEECLLGEGEF